MKAAWNDMGSAENLERYLAPSTMINSDHPSIKDLASQLRNGSGSQSDIAKNCFEWVRDCVSHSFDYRMISRHMHCIGRTPLQDGYCYAKSHLLAALLRANNIPSGLCYQRLRLEHGSDTYCLHGLNAVYLQDWGWYRIDARGNKQDIDAQFCPPEEKLAFMIDDEDEYNVPELYAEPLEVVVDTLTTYKTYLEVYQNLPDVHTYPMGRRKNATQLVRMHSRLSSPVSHRYGSLSVRRLWRLARCAA